MNINLQRSDFLRLHGAQDVYRCVTTPCGKYRAAINFDITNPRCHIAIFINDVCVVQFFLNGEVRLESYKRYIGETRAAILAGQEPCVLQNAIKSLLRVATKP